MILFHHRAVEAQLANIGCRGWNRTSIRAFKGRCPTIRRPGKGLPRRVEARGARLVESEVVATSPYRIKSPVPVCCGFDSMKLVLATGCLRTATGRARRVAMGSPFYANGTRVR